MKTKSLLLWLMLLVGVMGAEAKEAYAYYEYDDNSLNFSYDDNKSYYSKSSDYIVYSLNTGSNTPAWNSRATSIEAVYFGSSFANYKPTTCYRWFDGMTNLEEVDVISYLNTSNVTRMDYMFRNCSKLTSLNLSTFNTQNVTTMYAMFDGCSKLTSLNVSGWSNTKVTDMALMFDGCSSLPSINLSNFKTPSAKTMSCMFLNCKKLTSINVSSFTTSNVTTFYRMFDGCSSLTSLDLSGFSAAKITSSDGMNFILNGCSALKTLKLSSTMAGCSYYTDYSCTGIGSTSSPCTLSYPTSVSLSSSFSTITADYVKWKGGYFKSSNMRGYTIYKKPTIAFCYGDSYTPDSGWTLYELNTGESTPAWHSKASEVTGVIFFDNFINARPTSCYRWFDGMVNLSTFNQIASNLNTSKVTTMAFMFYNCSELTSINVSNFNTSNATNMAGMFQGCTSLTSLNIRNFNMSNLTSTGSSSMMYGCSGLKELTIPSTASKLSSNACTGVGTTSNPCWLSYPSGFTPTKEATGDGWFKWKSGYFLDNKAYANLSSDKKTLTFYYDDSWLTRPGNNYSLNTGSNEPAWHSYASSVTSVVFNYTFASARPTSCYEWFDGMTNLISITNMSSYLNTSQVTNMAYMFYNCKKLASVALSGFNTANVTSMRSMFYSCINLTSIDVSGFNTAKVTDMEYMFYDCSKLTSLNIGNFNLSSLTASTQIMRGCSGLKTLTIPSTANKLDNTACVSVGTSSNPCTLVYPSGFTPTKDETGDGWYRWKGGYFTDSNTKSAYAFLSSDGKTLTFYYNSNRFSMTGGTAYPLNQDSNTPGWNSKASTITSVKFDASFANARPTSCYRWFYGMSNITGITGLNYLITWEVLDYESMFEGCTKLASVDLSGFDTPGMIWDDEWISFYRMFANCTSLTSIDLSKLELPHSEYELSWDGYYTKDMVLRCFTQEMFSGCSGLKTLSLPTKPKPVEWIEDTYYENYESLNDFASNACTGVGTKTSPCTLIYPSWFTPDPSEMGDGWFKWKGGYFYFEGELKEYAQLNESTSTLTFYCDEYSKLRQGNVYDLNTGTNAPAWNAKASDVTTVKFDESFEEASPTTCYRWFYNMTNLTKVEGVEHLDTRKVTNMAGMFQGCSSLTSLDLGSFNTAKVTNMSSMFSGCTSLKNLSLYSEESMSPSGERGFDTEFVTTKVTNMKEMFKNCKALTNLPFPGLALTSKTTTTSMFSGCSAVEYFFVANDLSKAPATSFAGLGTAAKPCELESVVLPSDAEYTPNYMLWKGGYFKDAIRRVYAVFDTNTLTFYYSNNEWAQMIYSDTFKYYSIDNSATTPAWSENATKITKVVFTDEFKYARPTTCQRWFNGMTKLATITGIENLNTSYVTNMAYMFQNCKKLKTLDISGFTLSSSTTTTSMLKTCSALTSLSIPATANYLNASACSGVGTQAAPCALIYPSGFTPEKTSTGSGWYMWKAGYFKDSGGIKGDADGDGGVSLIDIMMCVDYILGKNPNGFIFANADMDDNKDISLADIMAIVDIILNQTSTSIPATARESGLDALALTANGSSCTLHLDNSEPCRGISFTVTLPEGGTMGNISVPVSRADGHHAIANAVAPGRYNVVVYANSGRPLRDGTTAMLRFDISGCQADDITVSDIQMVNNWNETILLPATYGITTGIAEIDDSDSDDGQPWYNTVGVGSSKPTRGVNIHNGKKTVVK